MNPHFLSPFAANDVIILAGGFGKRLQGLLGGAPKPMAQVMGKPFLEWVLLYLRSFGFRSFVISIGYRREAIRAFFGTGASWGAEIRFVEEEKPLGTAGALRIASAETGTAEILVLNGDSLCLCDLGRFYRFHRACGGEVTLCCVRVADASRYGTVAFNDRRMVKGFGEKQDAAGGWINAGMYWMRRTFLEGMGRLAPLSLERDVLPRRVGGDLYAYCSDRDFIDIGTPEELVHAPEFIRRNRLEQLAREIRREE